MKKRKLTRAVSGQSMQIGLNDWNTVCETVERINETDTNTDLSQRNRFPGSGAGLRKSELKSISMKQARLESSLQGEDFLASKVIIEDSCFIAFSRLRHAF